MRWIVIATAMTLMGCATSQKAYLPDGTQGHLIDCSGSALSWGYCEKRAGEICKEQGYVEVSRNEDQGVSAGGSPYGAFAGTTHSRTMMIRCN